MPIIDNSLAAGLPDVVEKRGSRTSKSSKVDKSPRTPKDGTKMPSDRVQLSRPGRFSAEEVASKIQDKAGGGKGPTITTTAPVTHPAEKPNLPKVGT